MRVTFSSFTGEKKIIMRLGGYASLEKMKLGVRGFLSVSFKEMKLKKDAMFLGCFFLFLVFSFSFLKEMKELEGGSFKVKRCEDEIK